MCGRTLCTLSRDQLLRRCTFSSGGSAAEQQQQQQLGTPPDWRDLPCSPPYRPGYNLPPGTFLPVLYADPTGCRLISTMKWGLVPSWVAPDSSNFSLHMSNARVETLMEKASFRNLVAKRRRCALLCEGFYEWKRPKAAPIQAYFFHPTDWRQPANTEEPATTSSSSSSSSSSCSSSSLMFMAALFDVHKEQPGKPDLYSFTVITVPASQTVSEVHDRMPALLLTPEEIAVWLQTEDVTSALACLKPTPDVAFYPVSSRVNSTQHNDELCLRPIRPAGAHPTLDRWLPTYATKPGLPSTPPQSSPGPASSPAAAAAALSAAPGSAKKKPPPPPPDTGLTRWLARSDSKAVSRSGNREPDGAAKMPRLG